MGIYYGLHIPLILLLLHSVRDLETLDFLSTLFL